MKKSKRTPEFTVRDGRVLKGHTIIAYLHADGEGFKVTTPGGSYIGDAESPAHAMLMAARHQETA